jgi:hypothetical protein
MLENCTISYLISFQEAEVCIGRVSALVALCQRRESRRGTQECANFALRTIPARANPSPALCPSRSPVATRSRIAGRAPAFIVKLNRVELNRVK